MNDFTKEELQYLKRAIYERPSCITDEMLRMTLKLDEMIETYDTPQAIRERNEQHGGCF